jgi:NAD(P)-dependent dehydrogenase (short-subunit alcohol dehydrogenase family)
MVDSPWECRFPGLDSPDAAERVPLKIVGQPSHYAEVMLFFAAGASYVTGQTLLVDGGLRV